MYYGPSDPDGARAELRSRQRGRPRQPLRAYLSALVHHPNEGLSDIAFERPWLQGLLLLLGSFAAAGAALGWIGLPGMVNGAAGVLGGALFGTGAGAILFLLVTIALHGMAKILEGEGTFVEVATALAFAVTPAYAIAPVALLRFLPGGLGRAAFFVGCFVIVGWMLRLIYLAVREGERFSGTQANLTIFGTVLAAVLGMVTVFFVTAIFVLATA